MLQKSFKTDNLPELKNYLVEVSGSRDYLEAGTVLAQVFVQTLDGGQVRRTVDLVCDLLPKAQVCGMTNLNREFYNVLVPSKNSEIADDVEVNLLFFEEASVEIIQYDLKKLSETTAGASLGQKLCQMEHVRGVMVFAPMKSMVEDFLMMAAAVNDDVAFFGAMAAGGPETEQTYGYTIAGRDCSRWQLVVVIFSGETLAIRTGYNFGWTPIGRRMTITKMEGELCVVEIDGMPADEIYQKYLGLVPHQITPENICEFPLVVDREERLLARTGLHVDHDGALVFSAPVFEGDKIRLSYGNPSEIMSESFRDSVEIYEFRPQALILSACMNRSVLMKEDIQVEKQFFTDLCPDAAILHGQAEILFDEKGGGLLNSALVTVAMREGPAEAVELEALNCDLSSCPFHQRTVPLVQRFMTFLQATTGELEEALIKAKEASRAKSDFLSSISHEIRTPINAVLGMDEMILRETNEDHIRHYAFDIQNSGRILLSLINDLLDSSRIDAGRMELLPVEYELSSALNDLVNMTSVRAKEKNLKLNVEVDESIPHLLYGDDTRLKQCGLNILTNAVKYTREGSITLKLGYEKVDGTHIKLRFSVTDTGIGIRQEDIDRLFAPYERIEEERNRSIEGTGLGMSIVKALLALMDSELEVESVYGSGSTFAFEVLQRVVKWEPIGDFEEMYERSIESAEAYRESFRAPDARILVVDDTPMNITVVKGLLKETRIRVDSAGGGAESLGMVQEKAYDVIFLDQRMPEMDGIETIRRMKHLFETKNRHTPVIMLTANAVAGAREMFLKEGFDDYLTKPINTKKLEHILMRYIPQEKILSGERLEEALDNEWYGRDEPGETADSGAFLGLLKQIPEMDVKLALANCMKEEILKETIRDFLVGAKKNPGKIQGFAEAQDVENYTILVHALKSSSRLIGLTELSELAADLEACGDAGDLDRIRQDTPKLLQQYRWAGDRLQAALDRLDAPDPEEAKHEKAEAAGGDTVPRDQLTGAYSAIRELTEAFDYDGASDILGMLEGFRLPEREQQRVQRLRDLIRALDRDAILALLQESM